MCGRVIRTSPVELLAELFGLALLPEALPTRYNLAPTDSIPVIRAPGTLEMLRWGLTLPDPKHAGINARVESLHWSHYRDNLRERRCLVVVDGFYEWHTHEGKRSPYVLFRRDGKPLVFGGFFDTSNGCAILTKPSQGVVSTIHARMPVILERDAWATWLDPHTSDVIPILNAANANGLTAYPVSHAVNSVKNDDARLLERAPAPEEEATGNGAKREASQLGLF